MYSILYLPYFPTWRIVQHKIFLNTKDFYALIPPPPLASNQLTPSQTNMTTNSPIPPSPLTNLLYKDLTTENHICISIFIISRMYFKMYLFGNERSKRCVFPPFVQLGKNEHESLLMLNLLSCLRLYSIYPSYLAEKNRLDVSRWLDPSIRNTLLCEAELYT